MGNTTRLFPVMTFVFSVVVVLGIAARVLPPAETEYAQAAAPAHVNEKGVCVVIDPGHGGDDEGAIGENGTMEKDAALQTALRIQQELLARTKATVILTRDQDVDVSLEDRVKVASETSADVFISIHYDAFTDPDVRGITTYFFDDEDLRLAEEIHERLLDAGLDTEDRGIEFEDYIVLRDNPIPAVLLELGYITNPDDEANMKSSEYQEKVAAAIADGIVDYLRSR